MCSLIVICVPRSRDLAHVYVGDVMELPLSAAEMMVAEEWAEMIVTTNEVAQLALHGQPQTYLTN